MYCTKKKRRRRTWLLWLGLLAVWMVLLAGFLSSEQAMQQEAEAAFFVAEETAPCIRVQRETYTVVLPAQTVYTRDLSLPKDTLRTVEPGEDGELRCTAEVTYRSGVEIERRILSRELLRESRDCIVALGEQKPESEPKIGSGYIDLPDGTRLTYTRAATLWATAYTGRTVTASGKTARPGTVAVDPRSIPYGTRLYIQSSDGSIVYGIAQADDFAGDVGEGRIVLFFDTEEEREAFGERNCAVYFLGE